MRNSRELKTLDELKTLVASMVLERAQGANIGSVDLESERCGRWTWTFSVTGNGCKDALARAVLGVSELQGQYQLALD
ncbi:MAG: hypothetical protein AB7X49_00405 [Geminicoccaceae bacterium]